MTNQEFIIETKKLGINLTSEQISAFEIYALELLEYNKKVNLTAIKTLHDIYLKHFYDSITFIKTGLISNESILDIGTGAGFPGIVLKILFPNINLTLLDSNNKKITFLKYITQKLNLTNVTIINDRAEEYFNKTNIKYDIVTSRAVADLRILSELSIPFLKPNGKFISLKGKSEEELKNSTQIINILGGKITNIYKFNLPKDCGERSIIEITKINETPSKFPRAYKDILKHTI